MHYSHEDDRVDKARAEPVSPVEQIQVDFSSFENDVRCLKYEVKKLKERKAMENIAQVTVEEYAVEPPVDNSAGIESMKSTVNELKQTELMNSCCLLLNFMSFCFFPMTIFCMYFSNF